MRLRLCFHVTICKKQNWFIEKCLLFFKHDCLLPKILQHEPRLVKAVGQVSLCPYSFTRFPGSILKFQRKAMLQLLFSDLNKIPLYSPLVMQFSTLLFSHASQSSSSLAQSRSHPKSSQMSPIPQSFRGVVWTS